MVGTQSQSRQNGKKKTGAPPPIEEERRSVWSAACGLAARLCQSQIQLAEVKPALFSDSSATAAVSGATA